MSETPRRQRAPRNDWSLICITRLGKVSMLKHMDLHTARETYKKLLPGTRPKEYISHPCTRTDSAFGGFSYGCGSFRSYGPTDDWLEKVEVIGPERAELDPWHGVAPDIVEVYCRCGCRWEGRANPPENKEEGRWRELYREVPAAFWLAPDAASA